MRNKQKNISLPKDAYDALISALNKSDNDDSIANEIKRHFQSGYVSRSLLMRYDEKCSKVLISKKQLNHLIRLANCIETRNEYDFEFVDELELKKG